MLYKKELTTKYDVDVFVAGGGPAGVAAAVNAARCGKSVFLAEEGGCFGGMGTAGLVSEIMNFCDGKNNLTGRFGNEIFEELYGEELPCARKTYRVGIEKVKRVYDDLVEKSGAKFSFFTKLIDVAFCGEHIEYAVLSGKSGLFCVRAKIYVDCTGDGTLSYMAGAKYELGDASGITMGTTLYSLWANVEEKKRVYPDARRIKEAIEDGVIRQYDPLLPGLFTGNKGEGVAGGNVGHIFGVDPTDEDSLTSAMLFGRKLVTDYEKYYKEYLKDGFERLALIETANVLGVRESRRIVGDKMLTAEDFKNKTVFEDEIGRYSYPLDIHIASPDKKGMDAFEKNFALRHGDGESYGIPYGALTPKGVENLLCAGKCISASHEMQGSVRVIPGCYITGQAAGVAAALSSGTGLTRETDVRLIQQKLWDMGAYLPNFR